MFGPPMEPSDPLRGLNDAQREAVLHGEGPLLVLAGAGSGKTRVIVHRIARLVRELGVMPWHVLAVTFTNKAAGEMRERLEALLGPVLAADLWVQTFHAFGARFLRREAARAGLSPSFPIYDDDDQVRLAKGLLAEAGHDDDLSPRELLSRIDGWKNEGLAPEEVRVVAGDRKGARDRDLYARYTAALRRAGAVDFGDLLVMPLRLLEADPAMRARWAGRFRFLLVDEFQDTNPAQYRLLRHLAGEKRNVCVVGDDDQAIYRWRGADVENILGFDRDFPGTKVVKLEQNYRSTQRILRAANAVIARAGGREAKTLFTRNGEGPKVEVLPCEDERDEARLIALRVKSAIDKGVSAREVAVFYRVHAQSRPLEEALRAAGIAYVIVGGVRFYERAEVKDVLAYLRLLLNPNDDVSLLRVINTPSRKIGKTTLDRVQLQAIRKQCSLWRIIASGDFTDDVAGAARKALVGFYTLVAGMRKRALDLLDQPSALGRMVYQETGYERMLNEKNEPEDEARRENVEELLGTLESYEEETEEPTLSDWLERVTLAETAPEGEVAERVSLMTVHSAKGLEFQKVFITGLEEGMFPYKGIEFGADPEELEEERRLAYVAITRARQELTVSFTRFRQIFGQTKVNGPSRFLKELPDDVLSQPVARRGMDLTARSAPPPPPHRRHEVAEDDGPAAEDGPVLVRDGAMPTSYRRGSRVKHPKFGLGTVKGVIHGAELKLEVYFPGVGQTKVLLAQFVQPLY